MGAGYRPEVSLKAEIVKETFTLFVEGRADGILEQDEQITVDEIKGVYRSLDAMEKPDLLHLAQAKCYAAIYGSEQKLDVISVQSGNRRDSAFCAGVFSKRAEKLV